MKYKLFIILSIALIMVISSLGLISYNNTNNQSNFPVNSVYVMDDSEVSFSWTVYMAIM